MTQKMHAAFVSAFGKSLEFKEVDIPTPSGAVSLT
jgi:hypothetical protein